MQPIATGEENFDALPTGEWADLKVTSNYIDIKSKADWNFQVIPAAD